MDTDDFRNLIRVDKNDHLRVLTREGSTIEFKESYIHGNRNIYLKTIASFANNHGGHIIFGITDRPRRIIGLDEKKSSQFEDIKIEEFTQILNEYFSPEIEWETSIIEFECLKLGLISVSELENKPCICKKNLDMSNSKYALKEGEIYYRYKARSERIHYSELVAILNQQREREEKAWMNHFEKILYAGPTNIATMDLRNMDANIAPGKGFVLDKTAAKELFKSIKVIKRGSFSETKGRPVLRLIGNLSLSDEEEINDGDISIKYPYLLKNVAEKIGVTAATAKAMLWKYKLQWDKKYNLSIHRPNVKFPDQRYSQDAIDFLKKKLDENTDSNFQDTLRKEYNNFIRKSRLQQS